MAGGAADGILRAMNLNETAAPARSELARQFR